MGDVALATSQDATSLHLAGIACCNVIGCHAMVQHALGEVAGTIRAALPSSVRRSEWPRMTHGQGLTLVHFSAQPEPFLT